MGSVKWVCWHISFAAAIKRGRHLLQALDVGRVGNITDIAAAGPWKARSAHHRLAKIACPRCWPRLGSPRKCSPLMRRHGTRSKALVVCSRVAALVRGVRRVWLGPYTNPAPGVHVAKAGCFVRCSSWESRVIRGTRCKARTPCTIRHGRAHARSGTFHARGTRRVVRSLGILRGQTGAHVQRRDF